MVVQVDRETALRPLKDLRAKIVTIAAIFGAFFCLALLAFVARALAGLRFQRTQPRAA